MRIKIPGLLILLLFILSCSSEKSEFSLASFIGDVKIKSGDETSGATAGRILKYGDVVVSGRRSSAQIQYGETGVFRLSPRSRLRIADISSMEKGKGDLELNRGSVFCALTRTGKKGFRVKTPTVVASVRGTVFKVSADTGKSRVSVLKGRVRVNPVSGKKELKKKGRDVTAGKRATVTPRDTVLMSKKNRKVRVEKIPPKELKKIRKEEKWYNWSTLVKKSSKLQKELKTALKGQGTSLRKLTDHKAPKKNKKRKIWEFTEQKEEKKDMNIFDAIREKERKERAKNRK